MCLPWQSFAAQASIRSRQVGLADLNGPKWISSGQNGPKLANLSRAAKRGCFKRGGFPIWTCPSFFVLFCPFGTFPGIFPICSGMVRGFSRLVLFLSLSAYYQHLRGTVPKGSATQSGPFPKKVGNPPVWKHPGLASLKSLSILHSRMPNSGSE